MSEASYKKLLSDILAHGVETKDRTDVGTISLFGEKIVYDISEYFPLFTAKKVDFANIASELLWFLSGSTNVYDLAKIKNPEKPMAKTIWHDNAFASYWRDKAVHPGDCGLIYGKQWRSWGPEAIDQIKELEDGVKNNPHSRRHMLQSYNPEQVKWSSLPACHTMTQFSVREDNYLDCIFYMRSNDMLLGHPYNVASYALLTYMLCCVTRYKPGRVVYMGGDCHIYLNHIEAVTKYLQSPINKIRPTLEIVEQHDSLLDFTMSSFKIENYFPGPVISAPMAV